MSWINKQISKISPVWALKREIATRRLQRLQNVVDGKGSKRSFDTLTNKRLYGDILAPINSADSAVENKAETLRQQVRQLEYNNGFVSGPIQRIVNNVVGVGFQYQSRVSADDTSFIYPKITQENADNFNKISEKLFKKWSKEADQRLIYTFGEICRLAESSLVRDGEVLAIIRESSRKTRMIPHCIELLEADRLQTPASEISNPNVRNGISYDKEGAPKSYYVLKYHPGDRYFSFKDDDFEEIPAYFKNGSRKVLYLYNPMRPEQSRGFSQFTSALANLENLDRYQEAEILASLEDACMTGIVKTPAPDTFQSNYTVDNTIDNESRIHEFSPNQWHYLNPGEDVEIHAPSRPNTQYGEMVNQILRGPANALDVPPEVFTQNWQGMNYSNARTVLLSFYRSMRIRQQYLVDHLCSPVQEVVIPQLVIKGDIPARGFDIRRDDFLAHGWIPPGWQWIDPLKEAAGKKVEVDSSFESLANIHASKGYDTEEILEQRARELKRIKDLEEKYDISFNPVENSEPESEGNEENEEK